MKRIAVRSSNIKSMGYENGTLEVEFASGGVWRYSNVASERYQAMLKAPSVGSYFHQHIKTRHKAAKV